MDRPPFDTWILSREAVFKKPIENPKFIVPSSTTATQPTPWAIPPDSNYSGDWLFNSLHHYAKLPDMMLADLSRLMQNDQATFGKTICDLVIGDLGSYNRNNQAIPFDKSNESTTRSVTGAIICVLNGICTSLRLGPVHAISQDRGETLKKINHLLDWHLCKGSDVVICWEDKSQKMFSACIPQILEHAKENKQYPINTWQDKVTGNVESIMGKMAAALVVNKCHWGLLFGGEEFIVIFAHHQTGERPALFVSNAIAVDDGTTLLLALLLYMVVKQSQPLAQFVERLSIPVNLIKEPLKDHHPTPPGDSPTSTPAPSNKQTTRSKRRDMSQASTITTSVRDYDSPLLHFQRAVPIIAPVQVGLTAHILLHHRLYEGAVGFVMRASVVDSEVAVKFAASDERGALEVEASVYEILGRASKRPSIPVFYGLFVGDAWDALVMSFEGEMVEDFKALDRRSREQIMATLKEVHKLGVEHGDFVERNVVRNYPSWMSRFNVLRKYPSWMSRFLRPQYVLIDFSHASINHRCRGTSCHELNYAMEQLGLNSGEASSQLGTVYSLAFLRGVLVVGVIVAIWIAYRG